MTSAATIRAQHDGDAAAVAALITAAFADDGQVARLAAALRDRPDTGAGLVAVEDGRLVGHTQLSVSWVDAPAQLVEVLVLSPLSVAPDRAGQGIGGRLLEAACREAERLGSSLLFLEGDPGYYARHGWVAAGQLGFTAPSNRIPAEAFQVRLLAGVDRPLTAGALVYNDTFWSHDCVGLRG